MRRKKEVRVEITKIAETEIDQEETEVVTIEEVMTEESTNLSIRQRMEIKKTTKKNLEMEKVNHLKLVISREKK